GPFPGSVRLKFVTANTTTTGLPLPITAFGLGETIDKVGAGAARTFGASIPETMSIPTVAKRKACIRAFTLWIPPATVRGPAHDLPAPQHEDDEGESQEERNSPVGDERQAGGGRRDGVNRYARVRTGIQRGSADGHAASLDVGVR